MPLKTIQKPALLVVLVVNILVFMAITEQVSINLNELLELVKDTKVLVEATVLLSFVGIITGVVPTRRKEQIVFLKWDNPLPGSEAFTKHAQNDPRVDFEAIKKRHDPLPDDPRKQNQLWYKLYKTVDMEVAVKSTLGSYLFARDYTIISLLLLVTLGPSYIFIMPIASWKTLYLLALFMQFLFVRITAKNSGERLVATVLALAVVKEEGD